VNIVQCAFIEDHHRLARSVVDGLSKLGFGVDAFATAEDARAAAKTISYDAMVLDRGLPDRDGLDLLGELRDSGNCIPILILTARDGIDDRVAGLDRGADDYLLKPFAMKELAVRLRALLRRPGGPLGMTIEISNMSLDTIARQLKVRCPYSVSCPETYGSETGDKPKAAERCGVGNARVEAARHPPSFAVARAVVEPFSTTGCGLICPRSRTRQYGPGYPA
jgi:CheY-like chemotaxis protein